MQASGAHKLFQPSATNHGPKAIADRSDNHALSAA